MTLTIQLGATVTAVIDGHSAINGAPIPAGAKITLTSNDPTVATVPAVPDLTVDTPSLSVPVTVLAVGSTDISCHVDAGNAGVFDATASLIVGAVVAGLTHIALTLTSP
jgi:hypothetical protein